jgi:hypothetical protein
VDVRIAHTVAYLLRCSRSSVPEAMRACKFTLDESENRSKQMTIRRSLATQRWQISPPPRCYRHGDSWDDDSVAADKSNVYGQRRSIDADEDASEDTYNANNSRRYAADTAKTKAEADKEVGGGDAKVSD